MPLVILDSKKKYGINRLDRFTTKTILICALTWSSLNDFIGLTPSYYVRSGWAFSNARMPRLTLTLQQNAKNDASRPDGGLTLPRIHYASFIIHLFIITFQFFSLFFLSTA